MRFFKQNSISFSISGVAKPHKRQIPDHPPTLPRPGIGQNQDPAINQADPSA
jgi:hypothetical protein